LNLVILAAGLSTLVACENSDAKKKAAHPAPQAMAPGVEQTTSPPASAAVQPVAVKAQVPAPQTQKVDPVPAVIAEAEKAYASGEENFAAGKLDAARQDLNRALDILTQLKVDIQSDARLQREFDKISQ